MHPANGYEVPSYERFGTIHNCPRLSPEYDASLGGQDRTAMICLCGIDFSQQGRRRTGKIYISWLDFDVVMRRPLVAFAFSLWWTTDIVVAFAVVVVDVVIVAAAATVAVAVAGCLHANKVSQSPLSTFPNPIGLTGADAKRTVLYEHQMASLVALSV